MPRASLRPCLVSWGTVARTLFRTRFLTPVRSGPPLAWLLAEVEEEPALERPNRPIWTCSYFLYSLFLLLWLWCWLSCWLSRWLFDREPLVVLLVVHLV